MSEGAAQGWPLKLEEARWGDDPFHTVRVVLDATREGAPGVRVQCASDDYYDLWIWSWDGVDELVSAVTAAAEAAFGPRGARK